MSYRGFIPFITDYCVKKNKVEDKISILEIGVMEGLTTFPLSNNLSFLKCNLEYTAVDIFIRPSVIERYNYSYQSKKHLKLIEENSLNFLDNISKTDYKFDVILVDGDHNYETVKKECSYLNKILKKDGIVVFDDFYNKHSLKDSYYSEDPEYKNITIATERKKQTSIEGTRPAIEEYLTINGLLHFGMRKSEEEYHAPIVSFKKDNKLLFELLFSSPQYKDFLIQIKEKINNI